LTVRQLTVSEALDELLVAVPEFRSTFNDHVADHGILPHVLFGEFTRFVLAAHERVDEDLEQRALRFLERLLRDGDPYVENLVAVSFVENVNPRQRRTFVATWPETLRAEAERQQRPGRT
jgi:hypothetical protein